MKKDIQFTTDAQEIIQFIKYRMSGRYIDDKSSSTRDITGYVVLGSGFICPVELPKTKTMRYLYILNNELYQSIFTVGLQLAPVGRDITKTVDEYNTRLDNYIRKSGLIHESVHRITEFKNNIRKNSRRFITDVTDVNERVNILLANGYQEYRKNKGPQKKGLMMDGFIRLKDGSVCPFHFNQVNPLYRLSATSTLFLPMNNSDYRGELDLTGKTEITPDIIKLFDEGLRRQILTDLKHLSASRKVLLRVVETLKMVSIVDMDEDDYKNISDRIRMNSPLRPRQVMREIHTGKRKERNQESLISDIERYIATINDVDTYIADIKSGRADMDERWTSLTHAYSPAVSYQVFKNMN